MFTVVEEKIQRNDAYLNGADVARQLGVLPPPGSKAEARLAKLANFRTRMRGRVHGGDVERIADGVWIVRGGFPVKTMNVYFIEDDGGVTMFDAGIKDMTEAVRVAGVRLGGIKRIVLGHADADHRGAAPGIDAPVYCHPRSAPPRSPTQPSAITSTSRSSIPMAGPCWGDSCRSGRRPGGGGRDRSGGRRGGGFQGHRPAWSRAGTDRSVPRVRPVGARLGLLLHARPTDGDQGSARVPHAAFNVDSEQARQSIRKLAALEPSTAWAGHADPVSGDTVAQLQSAASGPVAGT